MAAEKGFLAETIVDHGSCFDSGSATHHLTLYKAASGALVFGAGTVQWAHGLDAFHDGVTGMNNMFESERRGGIKPIYRGALY